jgi:cation transport regulator ChaB
MPRSRRSGQPQAGELPGTLRRSSKEAQETFKEAHDRAVQTYGAGDQASRVAYAELKKKFEKRGDHWIAKDDPGPSTMAG